MVLNTSSTVTNPRLEDGESSHSSGMHERVHPRATPINRLVFDCTPHAANAVDIPGYPSYTHILARAAAHNSTTTVGPPGAGASKPGPGPAMFTRSSLNTCNPGASSLTARSIHPIPAAACRQTN